MKVSEAVIRLHCLPPPLLSEDAEPPGTNSWLPLIPEPGEVGLRRRRREEGLSPREELGSTTERLIHIYYLRLENQITSLKESYCR